MPEGVLDILGAQAVSCHFVEVPFDPFESVHASPTNQDAISQM
jgi:hypothetical protein